MTVDEVAANGDRRAAAEAEFFASGGRMSIKEVAAATGLGERQAGTVRRQWKGRLAANGGGPASGVSPPRLPAPRAIAKKTGKKKGPELEVATWRKVATTMAVVVVTGVAALLSYSGLRQLAIAAGLGWHADILPLAVDGLVAVCLLVRTVDPSNGIARLAMWLALVASVAANAYAYGHPWDQPLLIIAAAMAGFMPIAAGVGYHLLGRMLR